MTATRYRPTISRALILASDPLIGALVGAAVELAGCEVMFPTDVTARDALRLLRPAHLLIECDDPAAADEVLLGNALMYDTRLYLFGSEPAVTSLIPVAERYRMVPIAFPRDVDRLWTFLATTGSGSTLHPPRSTAP